MDCLFHPDSVTWRVHADGGMLIGGLRALLMQPLHPEAMAGFAMHSRFREESWNRLYRTAEYVGTVTYGSVEEADRAVQRVRMIHNKLGLDRPDLLLWVHAALTDSFLAAAQRSGMPMAAGDADQYVREMVLFAELVGCPVDDVPHSVSELQDYFASVSPKLQITAEAKQVVRFIVLPPMPAWVRWATPAVGSWAAVAMLSAASLPKWARDLYGWRTLPGHDLGTDFWLRGLRSTVMAVPPKFREGPHLKAARARLQLM
jgi:uncharacterized protein (DUF2236 family)